MQGKQTIEIRLFFLLLRVNTARYNEFASGSVTLVPHFGCGDVEKRYHFHMSTYEIWERTLKIL